MEPDEGTEKEQAPPPNKQRAKPGDKSGKPASVAELRERAAELGVQVDNRWGADRLRKEIAVAQDGEG